MYVYIKSEAQLYTVGFYAPDGSWIPESDHSSSEEAAERTAWLNGSRPRPMKNLEEVEAYINEEVT